MTRFQKKRMLELSEPWKLKPKDYIMPGMEPVAFQAGYRAGVFDAENPSEVKYLDLRKKHLEHICRLAYLASRGESLDATGLSIFMGVNSTTTRHWINRGKMLFALDEQSALRDTQVEGLVPNDSSKEGDSFPTL